MKKFEVAVCRTSYAFRTLVIEAENEEKANELALEQAGDYVFSESSAEYNIDTCVEAEGIIKYRVSSALGEPSYFDGIDDAISDFYDRVNDSDDQVRLYKLTFSEDESDEPEEEILKCHDEEHYLNCPAVDGFGCRCDELEID